MVSLERGADLGGRDELVDEAGDPQVADAYVGLVHGNGGVLSSQATALLGDATTF